MKKAKRKPAKATQNEDRSLSRLFSNLKYSLPITLGVFLGFSLLAALALYFLKDPAPYILPAAFAVAALSAFFGGLSLCKRQGNSALLCGLINGCFALLLLLLASLFFRKYARGYTPLVSTLLHLGFLFFSILGAFCGLPKLKQKR